VRRRRRPLGLGPRNAWSHRHVRRSRPMAKTRPRRHRRVLAGGAYRQGPPAAKPTSHVLSMPGRPQCAYGRAQVGLPPPSENSPSTGRYPEVEVTTTAPLARPMLPAPRRPVCGCRRHHYRPGGRHHYGPASSSAEGTTAAVRGFLGCLGAVAAAEGRVGTLRLGRRGPGAFDCSGLVMWATPRRGIPSSLQRCPVRRHDPHPDVRPRTGDLVFPATGEHVAIYIGNGEIVQAPYTAPTSRSSPHRLLRTG